MQGKRHANPTHSQREAPHNRMQWLRGDPSIDDGAYEMQGELYEMHGFSGLDILRIGKAMDLKEKGSVVYE